MLTRAKYTSSLFILGILFIIAIPPSALFMSEYGLFSQAIILYPTLAIILFIALGIVAYAMLSLTINMIFATDETDKSVQINEVREKWNVTHTIILIELILVVLLALWFTTGQGMDVINNIVKDFLFIK